MRLITSLLAVFLAACSQSDVTNVVRDGEPIAASYRDAILRLKTDHVVNGYVVSRTATGEPQHVGEGILWSGLAIAHLPCADAKSIFDDLYRHFKDRHGRIRRYEPLADNYIGRELNFDGETGIIYGLTGYLTRCGDADGRIAEAWRLHQASIKADGGQLFPGTGIKMPRVFEFSTEALSHALGQGRKPEQKILEDLETGAAGWAWALHKDKVSCFRAHLAFRHLRVAQLLGYNVKMGGALGFCAATRGMRNPLFEHHCGRGPLSDWVIKEYQPNQWEHRFQRCGEPWELPDGRDNTSPSLDLIEALDTAYALDFEAS